MLSYSSEEDEITRNWVSIEKDYDSETTLLQLQDEGKFFNFNICSMKFRNYIVHLII